MQQSDPSATQMRRFLQYLRPYKFPFFAAILGMVGYSAVDTFVFAQLQPMIDESLGNNDHEYLRLAAYAIVPLFVIRGVFNFLGTYTLTWIGSQVVMNMRQQLFAKYIHLPVTFHDTHSVGNLISKVTFDTEQVANASGRALLTLVREGALVIGLLAVMFYYSWQLSLIFLIIGPVVAVIVSVVSKRFRKVSRNIQHAMGNLTTAVEQAVKGHKVVLMFGGQEMEQQRFAEKNNANRQQTMKLAVTQILSVSSIQVIASIALAVVLYIASSPKMLETLTAGVFINVVFCMVMLLKPLKQLTTVNNEFQKGMAACSSIFAVLDEADENDSGSIVVERAKGKIRFDDVTFTYPGKNSPALNHIGFTAEPGQTIALVGRSGSGKSTISSLLTRFYSPQQGVITLDDLNLESIDLKSLRKQFALVSQHVILFNDSIANNIAYGIQHSVTREQIERAASIAHVDEFLHQLPDGLDTVIGENGLMLSGGQRQRIAIARAILTDAPILILDEATSALDTESERLIQDALEQLQKNRTSVVVAHRLSTIENADCILVIDNGRIIEQGKHQTLLEQKGHYAQLHALQFGEAS
ncbi:lipid A export permease/ATP-binding protein MsbA [Alteromonas aestuariivivens]|uniref:Lipid A export permease/ATP-binding protein MsbA n=1 Tax=Alteromonas aestuariivivens TaxID=1938339 RepID=A0A3D8M8W2_9ALTE|nr:lipid A export permease/ATP-binding protein MsbA [Alteromonas aestuariivivens]RDV26093.1 lipid A export permease/ATP-binding protein MsbA [Alteromonas aestuariivivens]